MRNVILLLMFMFSFNVNAEFEMPKKVRDIKDLDTAISEAQSKKKALVFILTNEASHNKITAKQSLAAVDAFDNVAIIVYVPIFSNKATYQKLPAKVREAFSSPDAGRRIPIVAIIKPDLETIIAIVPFDVGKDYEKLLDQAKKDMFKAMK